MRYSRRAFCSCNCGIADSKRQQYLCLNLACVERGIAGSDLIVTMLKKAESLGVSIACGSDSGAVGVPHGEGTRTELRLLKEAGLSDETIAAGNEKIRRIFRKQN